MIINGLASDWIVASPRTRISEGCVPFGVRNWTPDAMPSSRCRIFPPGERFKSSLLTTLNEPVALSFGI